jgi:uncharacterized UBP type Zn finger protein
MRERLADELRRVAFQRSFARRRCAHVAVAVDAAPGVTVCPSCEGHGDRWVHLRMCLSCGQVGCCDSSPERHARVHFEATGHPVIRSIEPGESWAWCYLDEAYLTSSEIPG